ncbi:MAG: hypothetical protein ACR2M4_02880 [Actinomycetota bacterium]
MNVATDQAYTLRIYSGGDELILPFVMRSPGHYQIGEYLDAIADRIALQLLADAFSGAQDDVTVEIYEIRSCEFSDCNCMDDDDPEPVGKATVSRDD